MQPAVSPSGGASRRWKASHALWRGATVTLRKKVRVRRRAGGERERERERERADRVSRRAGEIVLTCITKPRFSALPHRETRRADTEMRKAFLRSPSLPHPLKRSGNGRSSFLYAICSRDTGVNSSPDGWSEYRWLRRSPADRLFPPEITQLHFSRW